MEHPPAVEERLLAYELLLAAWAPRFDLIAPGDLGRLRARHIDDSLRALSVVERLPVGPCIDVGSGAGLPGVPLAIASERAWRLLEPRRKRAAFLEEVVRELDLRRCEVIARSAQQAATDPGLRRGHAGAFARALAGPGEAVDLCAPLVAAGGSVVLFVGADAEIPAEAEEVEPGLITIPGDAH